MYCRFPDVTNDPTSGHTFSQKAVIEVSQSRLSPWQLVCHHDDMTWVFSKKYAAA